MMDRLAICIEGKDLIELQRILIDEDAEGALRFLKKHFTKPLRDAEFGKCRPVFEQPGGTGLKMP